MPSRNVSGNVYRGEGKRRPVWFARYRLPDGRDARDHPGKCRRIDELIDRPPRTAGEGPRRPQR